MGFAAALAEATPNPKRCKFGEWASTRPESDQEEIRVALASDVASSVLQRAASLEGYDGSQDVLYRHRRKECQCPFPTQ